MILEIKKHKATATGHRNMTWSFPSSQALSFRSGHVIRTFVSIRHQNGMTKKKKVNFPKVTR